MKRPSLPYLEKRSKAGREYWYFRRRGEPTVRLPDPSEPDFLRAYEAARDRKAARRPSRANIAGLIDSYQDSPRWEKLAPRTQRDYRLVLGHIRKSAGEMSVSAITRPAIISARDRNRARPRFANYLVQVYSILCEHAVDIGWLKANPVKGTKLLKLGDGHKVWPAKAIEAYRAAATGNALLIFELCLGTGQRIGDVLKMRWPDIEGGAIRVKQGKTGNELWIPLTPGLAGLLGAADKKGLTIVAGEDSKPLSYRRAAYAVDQHRAAAGAAGYTIHGLRHSTAAALAEAGCTDAQIAAVTGHKSLRMVAKYRAGAAQKRLAKEAMRARERTDGEQ